VSSGDVKEARMAQSRAMIREALDLAFGSYIEQEATKDDEWRDKTWWQAVKHLSHEIKEIERSKSNTIKLHNLLDAIMLSAHLVSRILEEERAQYAANQSHPKKNDIL